MKLDDQPSFHLVIAGCAAVWVDKLELELCMLSCTHGLEYLRRPFTNFMLPLSQSFPQTLPKILQYSCTNMSMITRLNINPLLPVLIALHVNSTKFRLSRSQDRNCIYAMFTRGGREVGSSLHEVFPSRSVSNYTRAARCLSLSHLKATASCCMIDPASTISLPP